MLQVLRALNRSPRSRASEIHMAVERPSRIGQNRAISANTSEGRCPIRKPKEDAGTSWFVMGVQLNGVRVRSVRRHRTMTIQTQCCCRFSQVGGAGRNVEQRHVRPADIRGSQFEFLRASQTEMTNERHASDKSYMHGTYAAR